MEFDLLRVLAEHPEPRAEPRPVDGADPHRDWDVFDRSIDLRIMRLRRKIEADPEKPEVIKTVRGAGYIFIPWIFNPVIGLFQSGNSARAGDKQYVLNSSYCWLRRSEPPTPPCWRPGRGRPGTPP